MFRYSYHGVSDKGLCRQYNEDAAGALDCSMAERGSIWVLADGMGGHNAGDVASRIAVSTVLQHYPTAPGRRPEEWLDRSFAWANHALLDYGASHPEANGMGTTLAALALVDGYAIAASVGDSRIHLLRGEGCIQLTEDDTVVADMIREGTLTEADALEHPRRNVLTKALGNDLYDGIRRLARTTVEDGDTFLLCSDGLYTHVATDEFIAATKEGNLEQIASRLLDMALTRGGSDNITIQLIHVRSSADEGLAEKTIAH